MPDVSNGRPPRNGIIARMTKTREFRAPFSLSLSLSVFVVDSLVGSVRRITDGCHPSPKAGARYREVKGLDIARRTSRYARSAVSRIASRYAAAEGEEKGTLIKQTASRSRDTNLPRSLHDVKYSPTRIPGRVPTSFEI